jgi:hypothetical protein
MRNKVPEYCDFYHNDVTEDHSLTYRGVEETRRLTGEAMDSLSNGPRIYACGMKTSLSTQVLSSTVPGSLPQR